MEGGKELRKKMQQREIREKKELKNKKQKNASCCDTSFASMS
jgi:hypothetical protein